MAGSDKLPVQCLCQSPIMTRKPITDAELIAAYRSGAAARRASSILHKDRAPDADGITQRGGVVTVKLSANAQSVSTLGGQTKVLGGSRISIPEFRAAFKATVPKRRTATQK